MVVAGTDELRSEVQALSAADGWRGNGYCVTKGLQTV